MRNKNLALITAYIQLAEDCCDPAKLNMLIGAGNMLKAAHQTAQNDDSQVRPQGRPLAQFTISTPWGAVHVSGLQAVAALVAYKAATVQSKLSAADGKLLILRQDPETHEPAELYVLRGEHGEHNDNALKMLEKISVAKSGKVRHKNVTEAATSPGLPSKHVNKLRSDK